LAYAQKNLGKKLGVKKLGVKKFYISSA